MKRRIRVLSVVVAILALVPGTALGVSQTVTIQNFTFVPSAATIAPGETITWRNADGIAHTATSNTGAFDTGQIAAGASKSVTFAAAGTFAYHCAIHPSMTGTITVQGAPAPTPPPTAPPTPRPTAPPTPPPTVPPVETATASPVPSPSASPTASPSATPSPTPVPSPSASSISLASPSPTATPGGSSLGGGPGPLVAALVVGLAVALAGLAIYLYRRR